MRSLLATALAFGLTAPTVAGPAIPAIKKGTPYPAVRSQLIAAGYQPLVAVKRPDYFEDKRACQDGDTAFLCAKFPEFMDCSRAGMTFCAFAFRREADGTYWIVITAGEWLPEFGVESAGYQKLWRPSLDRFDGFVFAKEPDAKR